MSLICGVLHLRSPRSSRGVGKCSGGWDGGDAGVRPSLPKSPSDICRSFQIYNWMDNFVTEYSDIVSKIQIGHSFENRSILVLKVKAGGVDH